jgi:PAS domain S-box-containing protein
VIPEDITLIVTMIGTLVSFFVFLWVKVLRPASKFMDKQEEALESIKTIKHEITTNEGGSLKDAVCGLSGACERIERSQKIIEQRTKASLHYSNTALFETDSDGKLIWTNEPFYDLTGMTLTDIEGFDWLAYIHEDDREEFLNEFESCLSMNRRFSRSAKTADDKNVRMLGFPYKINEEEHGGFLISVCETLN